jgi:hypothetical protein
LFSKNLSLDIFVLIGTLADNRQIVHNPCQLTPKTSAFRENSSNEGVFNLLANTTHINIKLLCETKTSVPSMYFTEDGFVFFYNIFTLSIHEKIIDQLDYYE